MTLEEEVRQLRSMVAVLKKRLDQITPDLSDEDNGIADECTTDSPDTLGAASEGSESADSSTWTCDNETPVEVYVQSRTGYYHSGDEKLYAYIRKLTIDSCGKVASIGAETRVEVDAPEDC